MTRMKEHLRIKSKTSLEKTGKIKTEAVSYLIKIRQLHRLELMFETMFKNRVQNHVECHDRNRVENHDRTVFKTVFKNAFEIMFEN